MRAPSLSLTPGMRSVASGRTFATALLVMSGLSGVATAAAADAGPELRIATAYHQFSGTRQLQAAWHLPAPAWLRASRLDLAVGAILTPWDTRPTVGAGPVWQWRDEQWPLFVEFGFSPTVLGGSSLGRRDLGGNVHFSSSLAVGRAFGRRRQHLLALRVQHLSNGGLHRSNPGLDTVGLGIHGLFGNR